MNLKNRSVTFYVKEKHMLLQEFLVSYHHIIVGLISSVTSVRSVISLATSFLSCVVMELSETV